jgi:hypothetical protein
MGLEFGEAIIDHSHLRNYGKEKIKADSASI